MERKALLIKQTFMSNNKTIVPGIGGNGPVSGMPMGNGMKNPYNGTYVPGMQKEPGKVNKRPVMGFLFSVSRTEDGEYWPLYLGQNSIGKSEECDIRLPEETVSNNHANIVIRLMHNPDGVLVFIEDTRSTCGTMVNDSSLGLAPVECHNGDIIKVGSHYDLYLILIDSKRLGLSKCEEFIPAATSAASVANPYMTPGVQMPYTPGATVAMEPAPAPGGFQPAGNGGTVIMNPGMKL